MRLAGCGHRRQDDAVLVLSRIGEAHGPQLANEEPAQLELSRRARVAAGRLIGLGVDADISAKAVEQ